MQILSNIGLILFFVFLNGFFVASEFALISIRNTRLEELIKKGSKRAERIRKAKNHLNTYISATQFGVTLSSLALGWIGEPALANFMEPWFRWLPPGSAFITMHTVAATIAFSLITFLHIVLGELTPKSIALQKPEQTSLFTIMPLTLFATIFRPFISILNAAGSAILRLLGYSASSGHGSVHSEEEIKLILSESAQGGTLEKEEAEMVRSALKFDDIPVTQVMVPCSDIVAFDRQTPLAEAIDVAEKNLHSRFPVYQGSIDHVVGFVHIKDLYYRAFTQDKEEGTLNDAHLTRDILYFPENKLIDDALVAMRAKRVHIAIVQDGKGKTVGVATLEDIVENLVGDIEDEFE